MGFILITMRFTHGGNYACEYNPSKRPFLLLKHPSLFHGFWEHHYDTCLVDFDG
jgi:hypothetical protein